MNVRIIGALLAGGLAAGAASTALADQSIRQLDGDRVMITDFSGKPPFKRRIVAVDDLSPAEFARFEAVTAEPTLDRGRIGQRVTLVDFRGKPPFRRSVVEIDETNVAAFARFEEAEQTEARRPARTRAPGKGFPARR
jgi:hypothetical protein